MFDDDEEFAVRAMKFLFDRYEKMFGRAAVAEAEVTRLRPFEKQAAELEGQVNFLKGKLGI